MARPGMKAMPDGTPVYVKDEGGRYRTATIQEIRDIVRRQALDLCDEGFSQRQIAASLGVSHTAVGMWRRAAGRV